MLANLARRIAGADSWVVGYPKCGNTWFGVMLRKALTLAYGLDERAIPRVLSDWRFARGVGSVPAIGMTHHMPYFNTESYRAMRLDLRVFAGRRVVLLIRDPKDALVSLYMHNMYREMQPLFGGDVDAMVYDDVYGIEKFLAYYGAWDSGRHIPRTLMLIRYEDLARDTEGVIAEALDFLSVPRATASLVREVAHYGSFENMRKLEATNATGLPTLAASPHRRDEAFKVRKGVVGGYVEHLCPETVRHIDQRVRASLPDYYGYGRRDR